MTLVTSKMNDVVNFHFPGQCLQTRALGPISNDKKPGQRKLTSQSRKRPKQQVLTLDRREPTNGPNNNRVFRYANLGSNFAAVWQISEGIKTDTVSYHTYLGRW